MGEKVKAQKSVALTFFGRQKSVNFFLYISATRQSPAPIGLALVKFSVRIERLLTSRTGV